MSGQEKPIWEPTRPQDRAALSNTANRLEVVGEQAAVGNTTYMPVISWEYSTIQGIEENLRKDKGMYTFLLANFGGRVAGMSTWRFEVLSGASKPSEVLSVSSEAMLILILVNYWKAWEAQMKRAEEADDVTESSGVSSITTPADETAINTRCTRKNNGSTKDGWSVEGIRHFEKLMNDIKEDRASDHGKNFEEEFQNLMRQNNGSRKRRRANPATDIITSIQNDLSDASTDGDEPETNETRRQVTAAV